MLKSFHLEFTMAQLTVVSNLSELHKARVLHHWRLVGIPMIGQAVKYANASTVANCHLCSHPFRNLYKIKENGDKEKVMFAAMTRKHQIEADRVVRGIGSAAAVKCCGMPFCPLFCMCVWRALPQFWAPVTNAGRPGKMYRQQHPKILTLLQQFL